MEKEGGGRGREGRGEGGQIGADKITPIALDSSWQEGCFSTRQCQRPQATTDIPWVTCDHWELTIFML